MPPIASIRCTNVLVLVGLGYYDAEGRMVGEATFPQAGGNVVAAKLFHPHQEQLGLLIDTCIQQAWEAINAGDPEGEPQRHEGHEAHEEGDRVGLRTGR